MKKSKEKNGKLALILLTKSLRKQSTESLKLIVEISNKILEERCEKC